MAKLTAGRLYSEPTMMALIRLATIGRLTEYTFDH